MSRFTRLLATCLTLLMLVPAAYAAQVSAVGLTGSHWTLVSYGDPANPTPVIAEGEITLDFETANHVRGHGGCNGYSGPYTLESMTVAFGPLVSTRMACADNNRTQQEQAYMALLQDAASFEVADGALTITTADGQVLNFALAENRLLGTRWELVSFTTGSGTGEATEEATNEATDETADEVTSGDTPVIGDGLITLAFESASEIGGTGGCNFYGGSYTLNGQNLSFSGITSTLIACADADLSAQEMRYLEALQTVTAFEVTDDTLTLWYDGGQLHFVAVEPMILAGSVWGLVAYGNPNDPTPVIEGSEVTLAFGLDNEVSGNGGCNQFGGSYTVDVDEITFSDIFSTLRACADDAVTRQEGDFHALLREVVRHEVINDQLILWTADGQQLVFALVAMSSQGA